MRTAVITSREYKPIPVTIARPQKKVVSESKKYTEDIEFYKQYVADLRNGNPVENISPSNDPYFLVPENIEDMIEGMEQIAQGQFFVVEDPSNIWECIK